MENLSPIKQNLIQNLWRIVNNQPIETISFMEYLVDRLIVNEKKIKPISLSLLKKYGLELKEKYSKLLDYVSSSVINGNLIEVENYVKQKVNGEFSTLINKFMLEYEDN